MSDLRSQGWRFVVVAVLVLHAAVHLVGALLLWEVAEVGEFTYAMATPDAGTTAAIVAGVVWLAAAGLFLGAGVALGGGSARWSVLALVACAVSAPVLLIDIGDAGAGLVVDAVIAAVAWTGRQSRRGSPSAVPVEDGGRASGPRPTAIAKALLLVGATAVAAAVLSWSAAASGVDGLVFAFVVVWAPMTWLGTISRIVQPRLPDRYHELRRFERSGRLYEGVGVKAAKWLLRRGPIAVFNPKLHLPPQRTPERIAQLDQKMRDAEASHFILLLGTTPVAIHAAVRGWWAAAAATMLFNLLLNGYPVMLQRYNRALLGDRYAPRQDADRNMTLDAIDLAHIEPLRSARGARAGHGSLLDVHDRPTTPSRKEIAT